MKWIITLLNLSVLLGATTLSFAQNTTTNTHHMNNNMANSNKKWICTTNASSAPSGSAEEKADQNLANNARSVQESFRMAVKHCRDCTKITCEKQ